MARRMRYGPRFSNASTVGTRGRDAQRAAMDTHDANWSWIRNPRSANAIIIGSQAISATARKKKGLGTTTLPTFSFQAGIDPRKRAMLTAAARFQGGRATNIILEQGGCALIAVVQGKKQYHVWVDIETGKIEGVETP